MRRKKEMVMEKRYICKNAICKYGGSSAERINDVFIRRQYPKGSTFVLKDDLESLGDSIDNDFKASGLKRDRGKFPKFEKALF